MKIILLFLLAITALLAWHMSSDSNLDPLLLHQAQTAASARRNVVANPKLVIIDYRKSLLQKRLWVIDGQTKKVLLSSRVSHAFRSGLIYASSFSNTNGSGKSCTGSFVTGSTYKGSFGYSLRVKGLDASNSNALSRKIVFHSVSTAPWSAGCFMTGAQTNTQLINLIRDGSFVYVVR